MFFKGTILSCNSTNLTSSSSRLLLDSGFTENLLVGESNLSNFQIIKSSPLTSGTSIIFGSGKPVKSKRIVRIKDVGDARLPRNKMAQDQHYVFYFPNHVLIAALRRTARVPSH